MIRPFLLGPFLLVSAALLTSCGGPPLPFGLERGDIVDLDSDLSGLPDMRSMKVVDGDWDYLEFEQASDRAQDMARNRRVVVAVDEIARVLWPKLNGQGEPVDFNFPFGLTEQQFKALNRINE
ncbi:MAG: hypothetical protein ACYS26_15420 [Planctomycetota bacterium]|jgi:hypothetical protein